MAEANTSLSGQDLLALVNLLRNYSVADDGRNAAVNVANDTSNNAMLAINANETARNTYAALLSALQGRIAGDPAKEEGDLLGRSNQIFSSLAGTVDRGNAIAASQGYAKSLRRGMGDSSQAADNSNELARNFGDVYQKLQEAARQRAFDELKASKQIDGQIYGVAANGLNSANANQMSATSAMANNARAAATTANSTANKTLQDMIESNAASWITKKATSAFDNAGGFSGLFGALQKGFGNTGTEDTAASVASNEPWGGEARWWSTPQNSYEPVAESTPSYSFDFGNNNSSSWGGEARGFDQPASYNNDNSYSWGDNAWDNFWS
jgi:hypothetical protein